MAAKCAAEIRRSTQVREPDRRRLSCRPQAIPPTQLDPEKPKSSPLARFPSSRPARADLARHPGDRPTLRGSRPHPVSSLPAPVFRARRESSVAVALTATCWKKGTTCAFSSWAQKRSSRSSWPRPSSSRRPPRRRPLPYTTLVPGSEAAQIIKIAKAQVGDPYRYGAMGPYAFDCSGLVLYSFKAAGDYRAVGSGSYRSAQVAVLLVQEARPDQHDRARRPATSSSGAAAATSASTSATATRSAR